MKLIVPWPIHYLILSHKMTYFQKSEVIITLLSPLYVCQYPVQTSPFKNKGDFFANTRFSKYDHTMEKDARVIEQFGVHLWSIVTTTIEIVGVESVWYIQLACK